MSTQRPFLSNFLAAFRARSAFQTGKATSAASSAVASSQQSQNQHNSSSQPSQPRSISTSTKHATSAALTSLHSPRTHSASPLSTSPGTSPADVLPTYGPHTQTQHAQSTTRYLGNTRGRRGSDSSSEGFRDVLGAEKWYIGGRTASGEEKYFKLGVIKRQRSIDRLSLDQLSL